MCVIRIYKKIVVTRSYVILIRPFCFKNNKKKKRSKRSPRFPVIYQLGNLVFKSFEIIFEQR